MPPMAIVAAVPQGSTPTPRHSECGKESISLPPVANVSGKAEHHSLPFTQSQLCLAITIQNSKPANINTREYCLQLQKHVKQGKPPAKGERRYIDTAEFWKDQYTKIHSEKKIMEMRLAELEVLMDQNRSDGRAAASELCSLAANNGDHQLDMNLTDAGFTSDLPLLRQALILHRLLSDDEVSTDVLELAIRSSLSYVNSAINEACKINGMEPSRTRESANHISLRTFDTAAAIFNICLKGLVHLCRDIPGRRCKGQVIFALVQVFTKALGHLHNTCLRRTVYQASNISKRQDEASHRANDEDTTKSCILIRGITKFLINILTCPDFREAHLSHIEVLEGMFSALLEEVGGLLSQVIFDERISTLPRSAKVLYNDMNISASISAIALDLKCRHLASVLKRAIQGRSEEDKFSLAAMLAGTKFLGIAAGKKVVLARARQRIQETLLRGIFGDDGDEFMNALQIPESDEGWEDEIPQVGRDGKDAFVESVWSVVGWEMMLSDKWSTKEPCASTIAA